VKKVLVITREYPGRGGGIAVPLLRYLPTHGCKPYIVTNRVAAASSITRDEEFGEASIEVHRTTCLNRSPFAVLSKYFHMSKTAELLESIFFIPDLYVTCLPSALVAGMNLIRRERIDTVLTISPPESTHLIGLLLSKLAKVRWLADFEDLWTTRKIIYQPPTVLHDQLIKKMERLFYRKADHLIANTYGNREVYINDFHIPESKISVIHGGYDPKDMAAIQSRYHIRNTEFNIGYMGQFDKPGYPWKELLLALKKLVTMVGNDMVRLNIYGYVSRAAMRFINENNLDDNAIWHGIFPHGEAFRMTSDNDILLVTQTEAGYSRSIVPCKVYHYLAMGRRILTIAEKDGELASIVRRTNTGEVVSARTDDGIFNSLKKHYEEWKNSGQLRYAPDCDEIKKYDLSEIAGKLSEIIKSR